MTVLTDAYVLRKNQRGDFDRQYVLFTRELGKVTVVAKGAMKITSKLAPHLDYGYLIEVMIAPGRVFYRLAAAKLQRTPKIPLEPLKLSAACFFLEVIETLTLTNNADKRIFAVIEDFFTALASAAGREAQLVLNRSLFELVSLLGYRPELKARSQFQLTNDLYQLALEVGEKEIKSFICLSRALAPLGKKSPAF